MQFFSIVPIRLLLQVKIWAPWDMSKRHTIYMTSVCSWLQWRILIKENSYFLSKKVALYKITTNHLATTKCILLLRKSVIWLLFTFQKEVLQFHHDFGNGFSSCCTRQSIKWRRISLTSKNIEYYSLSCTPLVSRESFFTSLYKLSIGFQC